MPSLFRKRIKLSEYLHLHLADLVSEGGLLRQEAFPWGITAHPQETGSPSPSPRQGPQGASAGALREGSVETWIGTFLWVFKYRTLCGNRNTARRRAFLDLLFDMQIPGVIDKHFGRYDTARIKEVYETMDILCKKTYTPAVADPNRPGFLASPVWNRDQDPPVLRTVARLYLGERTTENHPGSGQGAEDEDLLDVLESRMEALSRPYEETARTVRLVWKKTN